MIATRQTSTKKQVLSSLYNQLKDWEDRIVKDPNIQSSVTFINSRDAILEKIMKFLPEDVGGIKALDGRFVPRKYKSVWDLTNLKIHIDYL